VPLDESLPFSEKTKEDSILEIVLSLPKDVSTAIHLHYYENMSVRDISSAMSKSESAVKSLLFRGRKLLKSILSVDFNEKG
jgi:RNA polymerase sigma-70 factor (ECF subfamily)